MEPNVITIVGFLLNFVILFSFEQKNTLLFISSVIVRYICDSLDGYIARKYKKTSEIGGIMDTVSDLGFFMVLTYTVLK